MLWFILGLIVGLILGAIYSVIVKKALVAAEAEVVALKTKLRQ